MPYIANHERRKVLSAAGAIPATRGEMNFVFFYQFLKKYVRRPSYDTIHCIYADRYMDMDTAGILWDYTARQIEAAWGLAFMEFYRRYGTKHEDEAILKNGDITLYEEDVVQLELFPPEELHAQADKE